MAYRKILISVLSYLLVIVILLFLYTEFKTNWASIQAIDLKFDPYFTLLAFAAIVATYLLTTYGWYLTLNTMSGGNRISFRDSIAIVNTSNLTKYIPGKVWSYALQTYWLGRMGFAKSLIIFVYTINILTLIIAFLIVGLFFLLISTGEPPPKGLVPCLAGLVALDILFVKYYTTIFNAFVSWVNRIFKQEIEYYDASTKLLLRLHLVHIVSAFSFGMGAYLMGVGIGFDIARSSISLVMSSMIISDIVGYLSIIVPSGLGVREGIMYLILKGDAFEALSVILPVATRIVIIIVDVLIGAIGFALLHKYKIVMNVEHEGKQVL